jgi:hypothetical protein
MAQNGVTAMEPSAEAEQGWMDSVETLSQRTLLSKAQTGYVGANVQGKLNGLPMFTGSFGLDHTAR